MKFYKYIKEDADRFREVFGAREVLLNPNKYSKLIIKRAKETLGIKSDKYTKKEVQSAFRKKAKDSHPDRENVRKKQRMSKDIEKKIDKILGKKMSAYEFKKFQLGAFMNWLPGT